MVNGTFKLDYGTAKSRTASTMAKGQSTGALQQRIQSKKDIRHYKLTTFIHTKYTISMIYSRISNLYLQLFYIPDHIMNGHIQD
jgi:hypothetical protein